MRTLAGLCPPLVWRVSNIAGCTEKSLKSLSFLLFSPGETSKAAHVSEPREGLGAGHWALTHRHSCAGPAVAAPFSQESTWHWSGGSGVLTSSKGETENSPGAIFLCDLLSRVFPLGLEMKYFPE